MSKNYEIGGDGLLDRFIRRDYSPKMRQLIKQYGNEIIKQIIIVRSPLAAWTNSLLNIVSLGHFEKVMKRLNYDKYFHLNINIITSSNRSFVLEKNEVLSFYSGHINRPDSEFMPVDDVPQGLTLNTLLENARRKQGNKFFLYNASSNNCQVFIRDVLTSNGMTKPQYINFIMQNTSALFKNSPVFRKITNSVTDLGATVNNFIEGQGLGNLLDFDEELSNSDLEELASEVKLKLNGIYPRNVIPQTLKDGNYIVNLDKYGSQGTHWTCFVKKGKKVYYFDSFGMYPFQDLVNICNRNKLEILYNANIIQDPKSILCGYFCIGFLNFVKNSKANEMIDKVNLFSNMFDKRRYMRNDEMIKDLIRNYVK